VVTRCPIAYPTPALIEPTIMTWRPERSSDSRVTRPFATPTEKRARSVQARLVTSARFREKKKYGQSGTIAAPSGADHDRVVSRVAACVGGESEFLLDLRAQEDVRVRRKSLRDRHGLLAGEAFPLEHDGELGGFPLGELVDLAPFRGDLRGVQLLLCFAGEKGAAAHRDRTGDGFGEAGDDD
jgi:hypothetical protein